MTKRLIFVHPHFTLPGGAGKVVLEIATRLGPKYEVLFVTQKINKEIIKPYSNFSLISLNGPTTDSFFFWLLFPVWTMATWIKVLANNTRDTTIICSVFPSNWVIFPLKYLIPKLKIVWLCQEPSAFIHEKKWIEAIDDPIKKAIAKLLNPIFKVIDEKLALLPDTIVSNSEFSRNVIQKAYNRDSIILYPGIDTNKFKPTRIIDKKNYILTVSRLSKFKNIDILIKAFARLKDKTINLYIVGDGEEKENLQKLINQLKINSRIKILCHIDDQQLLDYYQNAKLFVLCSRDEPFGLVPIEAMACGTPVIADNSGGPRETVIDGKTGFLIDCNINCLTQKIDDVISKPSVLEKLFIEAPGRIRESFTWEAYVTKLTQII